MKKSFVCAGFMVGALASSALGSLVSPSTAAVAVPLRFEPNHGRAGDAVRFLARSQGYEVAIAPTGAKLRFKNSGQSSVSDSVLHWAFSGANPAGVVRGEDAFAGRVNYLVGNDPAKWHPHIPTFAKVRCHAVYPGIDLVYYGNEQQLEFDFIVAPGADPAQIRISVQGGQIQLNDQGDLILQSGEHRLIQRRPRIYQGEKVGAGRTIAGGYVLEPDGRHITVRLGDYDPTQPLVIDPVLVYSTYLGGLLQDSARGIAVDTAGNMYVVGTTASADFPGPSGSTNGWAGGTNLFVTKLNAVGNQVLYTTYLGGSGVTRAYGIAVDTIGNAVVMGGTTATNFPTAHALQATIAGGMDAVVCKLSADGSSLLFSTYLGGESDEPYWGPIGPHGQGADRGNLLALGPDGDVYVTGETHSAAFPTVAPLQPTKNGNFSSAFVTLMGANGNKIVYSTYLEGDSFSGGRGIAVDSSGNAYVTGYSGSGMMAGAFVVKLDPSGAKLMYRMNLAGASHNIFTDFSFGYGVAVDATGNAYVVGTSSVSDFPVVNAAQPQFGGGVLWGPTFVYPSDAFVSKINPSGTALVYSTFSGGFADTSWLGAAEIGDEGCGAAVDAEGNAYVVGLSGSPHFPVLNPLSNGPQQPRGAFVTKYDPAGRLLYSSAISGSSASVAEGVAVDANGIVYVTGSVSDATLPYIGAFQGAPAGSSDAFVVKITESVLPIVTVLAPTNYAVFEQGQSITITARATATAKPISQVLLYVGSAELSASVGDGLTAIWSNIPPGRFVLSAVAVDSDGTKRTNAVNIRISATNGLPGYASYGATVIRPDPTYESVEPLAIMSAKWLEASTKAAGGPRVPLSCGVRGPHRFLSPTAVASVSGATGSPASTTTASSSVLTQLHFRTLLL